MFRRSSVRYEGDIHYNAAGLRIQYTRQSTTNADKLLTVEQLGGIIYDTRGRELVSLRTTERVGTGTRNAYLLEDGKEVTAEVLRALLKAFSSNGEPVTIQNLMDRGMLKAYDAAGNPMNEKQIEAELRAHPVTLKKPTVSDLVKQGVISQLPDGTLTDGDGRSLSEEQVRVLIQKYSQSRPSTLQEAIDAGLMHVADAAGSMMTETDVAALLGRESRPAHVATIDELVKKRILRLESVPMTMDQKSAVDRYGAEYDDMGRLTAVTEETTDPATGLRTLTRIHGTTYDSDSRQDSSVTIARQYGESVRTALFEAGSSREMDALTLHELIRESGLSVGELIQRGTLERREAKGGLDQSTITYRKATRYYDSSLAEGFTDLISTKGFGTDGITEETQSSLTRYNEAGQMGSQLLLSHRTGMDTARVHKLDVDGQGLLYKDLVYEDLRNVMDQTGMSLKQLFDAGRIKLDQKISLVDTRTETFRHEVRYDPFTGFLVHQVDLSSGDQNPGVNEITFRDANYTAQGQLSSARTVNRSDLFGLEGNLADVWTQYARTPEGTLRFAEAVGNQSTFDVFGSTSEARLYQSFLGIAGQSRLAASVVAGVALEVDGSHLNVGQVTAYSYNPSAILIGAHGSNFREGSDIFLNYSRRSLESLYSIINGDARVKLSFSTDSRFGPENPAPQPGTGATFTTLPVAGDTDITGAAAAPFLAAPDLYISDMVKDYGTVKVYVYYNKKGDGSRGTLAGVQVALPGAPLILTDVTEAPVVNAAGDTVFKGGSTSQYRYVVGTDGSGIKATRYNISGQTETETYFSRTAQGGEGVFTTTQTSVSFKDGVRQEKITGVTHSLGNGTVMVGYLDGKLSGTVTVSMPGSVSSFSNVSGVEIGSNQIHITASSASTTLVLDPSNGRLSLKKENETVSVQRLIGSDGKVTLLTMALNSDGKTTRATWADELSGDILLAATASWTDGSAKVMITGMNGVAVKFLEGVSQFGFSQSDSEAVRIVNAGGAHTVKVGQNAQGVIQIADSQGASAGSIETGRDGTGNRVILFKDASGTVTRTTREEVGTTLTRIVNYEGSYSTSAPREAEMTIGPGFLREDSFVKADGTVGTEVTRRKITYLDMESGRATQVAKIEYFAGGSVSKVEMEQYNPDGAVVKLMQVLRSSDGKISGAQRQQYDANGNRTVMKLQPNADGSLNIVGSYVSGNGDRLRVLWIPNNQKMAAGTSLPEKQIYEMTVGQPRLLQVAVLGAASAPDFSTFLFTADDQWQKLINGQTITVTVAGQSYSIRLPQQGDAVVVTLPVVAPMPVTMAAEVVSYSGTDTLPNVTMLDLMKLRWSNALAQQQLDDFKAGKKITVGLPGGVTVVLRQAAVNPKTLPEGLRNALYGDQNSTQLPQRPLVSIEGYAGSLDSLPPLSEADRNALMKGLPVRLQQIAEKPEIRLFDLSEEKIVTLSGAAVNLATPLVLNADDWAKVNKLNKGEKITFTLEQGQVTISLERSLTQPQQERLGVGDSVKVVVLVSDGAGAGSVREKILSNVQVKQPVVQVIGAYYGTPTGMKVEQVNQNGTQLFRYTFINSANTTQAPVTIELKADGFAPGWQKEYQGTLARASTLQYGQVLKVTWTGQGMPPSLKDVRLTAAEWETLKQVGTVTREIEGGTVTLAAAALTGLSEQQVQDLKAGRFVAVGTNLLAGAVIIENGEYFITGANGKEMLLVREGTDGTVRAFKQDATGGWTQETVLSQEDAKAILSAKQKLGKSRSAAVTLKSQPLSSTQILDLQDLNQNGNRLEPAQLPRLVEYRVFGSALPQMESSQEINDRINLSFLNQNGGTFSRENGFVSRFGYDPNLPAVSTGIFGASIAGAASLFGLLGAGPRAPPGQVTT